MEEKNELDAETQLLQEGIQLAEAGQLEEALGKLKKATKRFPQSPQAWQLRGTIEMALYMPNEAELSFQSALELDPQNIDIRYLMAQTHSQQDLVEESVGELRKILKDDPDFLPAYFDYGSGLQILGRYDEALQVFRQRLEKETDFDTLIMCAMTCERLEDFEQAEKYYAEALADDPENIIVMESHGAICIELDRLDEAVADFLHALKIDPESSEAHYGLGHAYFCQDKTDQALLHLNRAVDLDPENVLAWEMLGQVHNRLERYEDVLRCTSVALELAPDLLCYDLRIEARRELGDLDGAMEEVHAGLEQDPDNVDVLWEMGETQHTMERFAEAVETFTRILEIEEGDNPPEVESWQEVPNVLFLRGMNWVDALEYEKALADFTRLIDEFEPDAAPFLLRGQVRYQMGDDAGAKSDLQKALKLTNDEEITRRSKEFLAQIENTTPF